MNDYGLPAELLAPASAADGLFNGSAATGAATAPSPTAAMAAVAEHHAPAAGAAPEAGGLTVETRVEVSPEPAAPGRDPAGPDPLNADDDYFADFAWPDGFTADPEMLGRFVPVAKKLGLSRESAHELARFYAETEAARRQAQAAFIDENNGKWLREIHDHPEFGGRNLTAVAQSVGNLLRRYGTPMLSSQMRQMNIQNWPEMFYFLARVAQAHGEDVSPSGQPGNAAPTSTARLLFPELN